MPTYDKDADAVFSEPGRPLVVERREPKPFVLDTRRLSDPAYLAECMDAGAERHLGHEVAAAFRRSVANVLRAVADQADREHMIGVIAEGIFNAHDLDVTDRELAAGAYDELVREGLIIGAAGDPS